MRRTPMGDCRGPQEGVRFTLCPWCVMVVSGTRGAGEHPPPTPTRTRKGQDKARKGPAVQLSSGLLSGVPPLL